MPTNFVIYSLPYLMFTEIKKEIAVAVAIDTRRKGGVVLAAEVVAESLKIGNYSNQP